MSNRNTKQSQKRQAKAKARTRIKKKQLQTERTTKRMEEKATKIVASKTQGADVLKLAERLSDKHKADPNKEVEEITNLDVLKGILDLTQLTIPIHAGVHTYETLLAEGKELKTIEGAKEIIDVFDSQIVRVAENVSAINVFIEADKNPEDYMDLLIDNTNTSMDLVEGTIPKVMELLEPNKGEIDLFINEHKLQDEDFWKYAQRVHGERMSKVSSKYVTKTTTTPEDLGIKQSEDTEDSPEGC